MDISNWFMAPSEYEAAALLSGINDRLVAEGLSLSSVEAQMLAEHRAEVLADAERIEFGKPAILSIVEAFAASPVLLQDNLVHTLSELLSIFYTLRNDLPIDIPDVEIIEALRECFDIHGDVDVLAAMESDAIMRFSDDYVQAIDVENNGEYRITDNEGREYIFKQSDWDYDEQASGWNGEEWSDDFDNE